MLCRGYIGIMKKEMETTIQDFGIWGFKSFGG